MEFTFLGTGAAEQYPGLWCTCEYCTKARKMGGRNIRHTSSGHFAGDCLIDFPPETFTQGERYGVDLLASRLLLVTHSHEDHFYPQLLYWRYRPKEAADMSEEEKFKRGYSRQQELPTLYIYGNQCTYHTLADHFNGQDLEDFAIKFIVPELYQEYECNGVRFVPMEASHIDRGSSKGLIYIVEAQGKTFLYASDSGPYTERTRKCIAAHKFDAVIMEQTFGNADKGNYHMDWDHAMEAMEFFKDAGIWKNKERIYWTHMSPHKTPPHSELEKMLEGTPITPAYDGLKIEI
ncbi:MBL fold metallo-hydrolase [Enterocloster citroniae]|uniref:MBL fold metallo-hydrolase n=1 Tax=Enterocloster citroniae TaxID=358743 RepID=UPI001896CF47